MDGLYPRSSPAEAPPTTVPFPSPDGCRTLSAVLIFDASTLLLGLERYREGSASLSKAAELAGVSISEMMDLLAVHGIPSDLRSEDYREGLKTLRRVWQ
jgi:hypothetical protein